MNPAKCDELDYIHFIIGAQRVFSCTEAPRCQPEDAQAASHDSFTRLLARPPPDTEALWQEVIRLVNRKGGLLVLDDTTLDKPYAKNIQLVTRHWRGKHHKVVLGINLITLLWIDGAALIPTDFRVYDKPMGGKNKNEHFRDMLAEATERGFEPGYVLFDSWYSSLDNLKLVRSYGWWWLTRLKSNRQVNPDGRGNVAISTLDIGPEGRQVHLKGYGFIQVFRTVSPTGDAEYWATNNLNLDPHQHEQLSQEAWSIESYHRGIKQCCGVETAQVRSARAQVRHISFSLRAFVRLEIHRLKTGVSWYEAKSAIIRDAIRQYLAQPIYLLNSTA
jgi:putative transposase